MGRIGLFGGTFDPPHLGHLLIAEEALYGASLDEVWFIPVNVPPHKDRAGISNSRDRVNMVRRAIQTNERFKLSEVELQRKGRSYSIDTVEEIHQEYPEHELFFIIGGDMIEYLPKWHRIEELQKLVTFIGYDRPEAQNSPTNEKNIMKIHGPLVGYSSTFVRQRVKDGKSIRYIVPDEVSQYIYEKGLYRLNEA